LSGGRNMHSRLELAAQPNPLSGEFFLSQQSGLRGEVVR